MANFLAFSVVLVALISALQWTHVTCFSGGAPDDACASLSPESADHNAQPDPTAVPFGFDLSPLDDGNGGFEYLPGVAYTITFDGLAGLQFRGVLFQGRLLADPDTPVGTFEVVDPGMLQLACNDTGTTHIDNNLKDTVITVWVAPPAGSGSVQIGFSVVGIDINNFWSDQRSPVIAEAMAATTAPPTAPPTTPPTGGMGTGGDPHFSIKLPSQKQLCYSIQGEQGYIFNLISNKQVQMNALFVADSVREEVTWIGQLGMVVKNSQYKDSEMTTIRFDANKKAILIGDDVVLIAKNIERLTFKRGRLAISEANRGFNCTCYGVQVELLDVGLNFSVHFVKNNHLDMVWDKVEYLDQDSHGLIGQFFRRGIDIDPARKLLILPDMEPVPVMRKPIWHFMEREMKQDTLCWVAMNPGYQGKRLIEGKYTDYIVQDLLSANFKI